MIHTLKRHWFFIGLVLIFGAVLGDPGGILAPAGRWLRAHHGPPTVIFSIFFLSGLILDPAALRAGLREGRATLAVLGVIFIAGPLVGAILTALPMPEGVRIGLILVAIMPTTLSSGIVMTGAAGGRMAHALVVTVAANALAVVTVPATLPLLLGAAGAGAAEAIDRGAMVRQLALLVLAPLSAGLFLRGMLGGRGRGMGKTLQRITQYLILAMVWMAVSQSAETLRVRPTAVGAVAVLSAGYHGMLLGVAALTARWAGLGRGRRESVIIMGAQKTLTLAVILQTSLFPQYGLALAVCVVHHLVMLMMDGYLTGRLRSN
jgi:solute carrier family 10 (sodium/bile acid cotransporter), member 7